MRTTPAEDIVAFLSFSSTASDRIPALQKVGPRKWEHVLRWLDDSGLAFYFLEKLRNTNADVVPTWVLARLERDFAANQQRVRDMSLRFDFLNQKFNEAGVRCAVLKGLSLIPQFCPDATLRYQSDFDYLVDDQASLLAAQRVLVEAGYRQKASRAKHELVFVMPGMGEASRSAEQYSAQAPHAVDLHLDVWESDLCPLAVMPQRFAVERRIDRERGFAFSALTEEDAFLVQVLHACQHLFTYWIRMCCFLEIGYFLEQRRSDPLLWKRVEEQVGDNLVLREFVVVVTELVRELFAVPLPDLVRAWGRGIRPATRVWIESYARPWAFCELPAYEFRLFPRAKLVLFLHQQYEDRSARKGVVRRWLTFPGISRIASVAKENPSLVLDPGWWKRRLLLRRGLFHALANLRYLCEIPRWRWLNRARMRVASLDT